MGIGIRIRIRILGSLTWPIPVVVIQNLCNEEKILFFLASRWRKLIDIFVHATKGRHPNPYSKRAKALRSFYAFAIILKTASSRTLNELTTRMMVTNHV